MHGLRQGLCPAPGAAPAVQAILNGILTWQTVITAQRLRSKAAAPQAA